MTSIAPSLPHRFARLRLAVTYLGQADAHGWWNSSFLSTNGLAIAAYNFPRSPGYAALNATTAAAKRLHDERIGRRRCVHLFRLSLAEEIAIKQVMLGKEDELGSAIPQSRDEAMDMIEAEAKERIQIEAGPVQIGNASTAFSDKGIKELAKHYLAAFRQDIQCLPYFSNVKQ